MNQRKLFDMTKCAMFTVLIAVGAFIKISIPVVPFTLQFLFTLMAGIMLGGKLGAVSVALYALLGLMGIPIFAEGGGIWYLLKPSFGYIIGFIAAAYVVGKMTEQQKELSIQRLFAANFIGLLLVYAIGMIYYYVVCNFVIHTPIGLWTLFLYCFLLAVPGDIAICIFTAYFVKRCMPVLVQASL